MRTSDSLTVSDHRDWLKEREPINDEEIQILPPFLNCYFDFFSGGNFLVFQGGDKAFHFTNQF